MKFRPQVQLRFRDQGQYEMVKDRSVELGLSMNGFILEAIDGRLTGLEQDGFMKKVSGSVVEAVADDEPPEPEDFR